MIVITQNIDELHKRAGSENILELHGMHDQGFFQQFWENVFDQNWEKMIDLTAKLEEINDMEHDKGSKIYPQNQVTKNVL